jgi:uncharacterized coiled-coil DUF342 family protein
MEIFIIIILGITLLAYISEYYPLKKESKEFKEKYYEIKPKYEEAKKEIDNLKPKVEELTKCINNKDNLYKLYQNLNISKLSLLYADLITLEYNLTEQVLRKQGVEVWYPTNNGRKKRFAHTIVYAPKAADKVKALEEETRGYLCQYNCMKYKYNALLEAFPEISQYVDDIESLKALNNFSKLEASSKYHTLRNTIEIEKQKANELLNKVKKEREDIERVISEAELGETKYLQMLISDYYCNKAGKLVDHFISKRHPIKPETAQELRGVINTDVRALRKQNKLLEYFAKYAIEVFPELEQFSPFELLVEEKEIEETYYSLSEKEYYKLSKEEYSKLEPVEKNQLKLDMWWTRRKSSTMLGRDYERYVGYVYEKRGYDIYYQGIEEGMQDRGIDLICENKEEVLLIQCKYWRRGGKPVREKEINQLYGTGAKYKLDKRKKFGNTLFNVEKPILMILITSNVLSDTAKEFSNALGVKYFENFPLNRYPIIKCNINNETKIYHLPFDQQYDSTKIKNKGEFYAMTVKEAENNGFRRAYRWRG